MNLLSNIADKQLREKLELSVKRSLSSEEAFEQKVSFVYSAMGTMTKDEVRRALQESAQQ